MTEVEALKRFIPILGRISLPGERATITRNILDRIAGQGTSVMGVSHRHAGALAWPNDPVKALAFEQAIDMAVDAGEFVSFIHTADRRHFQIEELSAWPNCPKVDTDSPLTFWLSDEAQTAATPAPMVAQSTQSEAKPEPAPVVPVPKSEPKPNRRTLWDVVTPYIIETMRAGQYASAKQLFKALEAKAGADSPFDKGEGSNRYRLFAREISQPMAMKTLQTRWPKLKAAAKY